MFAITDEETGRYLSRRSLTSVDANGNVVYVTYNGKLGTDFFTSSYEAEKVLNLMLDRIRSCGASRLLQIVIVDPDAMVLGQQFVEILNMSKKLAVI